MTRLAYDVTAPDELTLAVRNDRHLVCPIASVATQYITPAQADRLGIASPPRRAEQSLLLIAPTEVGRQHRIDEVLRAQRGPRDRRHHLRIDFVRCCDMDSAVVARLEAVADLAEDGQPSPTGLESARPRQPVAFARRSHVLSAGLQQQRRHDIESQVKQ